jgi:hypothetical protein
LPLQRGAAKTCRDTYPTAFLRALCVSVVKFCLSFASIRGLSDEASVLGFCLPACWRSRIHSRLCFFLSIRGIETLNDPDESLLHGGIR